MRADLTGANLDRSTLTNADLTEAVVTGASFGSNTGFAKEQLYSTANYQAKDLAGHRSVVQQPDRLGLESAESHQRGFARVNADPGQPERGQSHQRESVLVDPYRDLTGANLRNAYLVQVLNLLDPD